MPVACNVDPMAAVNSCTDLDGAAFIPSSRIRNSRQGSTKDAHPLAVGVPGVPGMRGSAMRHAADAWASEE